MKVCQPNARVKQNEDTLSYLLTKHCKNIKVVIAHVGENNIRDRCNSQLFSDYKSLASTVKNLHKHLIISGPIPSTKMNSEHFSRIFNLHNWLLKWTEENDLCYINNFDRFWKKHHLFSRYGDQLNRLGCLALSNQIKSNMKHI